MQKAGLHLKEQDARLRKSVFEKMAARRSSDIADIDTLFDTLIQKRTELAKNAGFETIAIINSKRWVVLIIRRNPALNSMTQ